MMHGERISVVIPTYNRAALLGRAVRSVLDQTLPVHEIIIVDDGSTDDTAALVAGLAAADARIRFVRQQRGGANRARNAGIARSAGDWLAFLDSDDAWEADKIARQAAALSANPDAIAAFTGLRMLDPGGERIFLPPDDPSLLTIRCANVLSSTSSAMVRTGILRAIGGFDADLPSCQDWDMWFRLRENGRFVIVREPLVRYDGGPHDRITSNLPRVLEGHERVFARLRAGLRGRRLWQVDAKHRLVLASIFLRERDPRRAAWLAVSSLGSWPSAWGVRLLGQSLRALVAAPLPPAPVPAIP